jgi:hypothetical protein
MISFDETLRYILILKEEAMENNYELSPEQIKLIKKVEAAKIEDISLNNKINQMINAKSINEMNMIWYGIKVNDTSSEAIAEPPINSSPEGGAGKQYVLTSNKRAGFVDAMIMALVTGFVSGMAISVLFLMMS